MEKKDYFNKNLVFYSNCQGGLGINRFLCSKINFKKVIYIETFSTIWNKKDIPRDVLMEADLFIYQPINKKYGKYSTDESIQNNILTYLKKDCIKISFPYIYFACLFPLYYANDAAEIDGGSSYDNSKIVNRDVILKLKEKYSSQEIISLYDTFQIDFNFKNRYENTIKRIKEKEKICDIEITPLFTIENIKSIKLMHTNNHPTNFVFKYITNKILEILNLPIYSFYEFKEEVLTGNNYSKYSYNYFNFKWLKPEDCCECMYKNLLNNLLN